MSRRKSPRQPSSQLPFGPGGSGAVIGVLSRPVGAGGAAPTVPGAHDGPQASRPGLLAAAPPGLKTERFRVSHGPQGVSPGLLAAAPPGLNSLAPPFRSPPLVGVVQ